MACFRYKNPTHRPGKPLAPSLAAEKRNYLSCLKRIGSERDILAGGAVLFSLWRGGLAFIKTGKIYPQQSSMTGMRRSGTRKYAVLRSVIKGGAILEGEGERCPLTSGSLSKRPGQERPSHMRQRKLGKRQRATREVLKGRPTNASDRAGWALWSFVGRGVESGGSKRANSRTPAAQSRYGEGAWSTDVGEKSVVRGIVLRIGRDCEGRRREKSIG